MFNVKNEKLFKKIKDYSRVCTYIYMYVYIRVFVFGIVGGWGRVFVESFFIRV